MKSRILIFALSSIVSSLSYCSEDRMPTELTPISQHRSPYTRKPERDELLIETRRLPVWNGCCTRNSKFVENMKDLTAADDKYDTGCCSCIGIEQTMYSYGCTCENPCVYIAASSSTAVIAPIAVSIAVCSGALSFSVGAATAIAGAIAAPCALITCCAINEAEKKCSSGSVDQLDYITDLKNWVAVPKPSSHDNDYEQEPLGADWSGYDS